MGELPLAEGATPSSSSVYWLGSALCPWATFRLLVPPTQGPGLFLWAVTFRIRAV